MSDLQLIKSSKFGEVECDIYSNEKEMFMTSTQLGECLGYSEPRKSISNLVNRFEYLKDEEFSGVTKMMTPEKRVRTKWGYPRNKSIYRRWYLRSNNVSKNRKSKRI